MKTLDQIIEVLKGNPSPGDLAEMLQWLSAEYAFCATQIEQILVRKPAVWIEKRAVSKSDSQADRAWELTEDGRNEIGYRWRLKALEKMMSAIKTRIRVMQDEAQAQY